MKKKLREDIKYLAQTIIDEEQTFNTQSIKTLTKEVYEKLIILEYLEAQIGENRDPEPKTKTETSQSLDSKSFREENWFSEPEPVPQPEHDEDLVEPLIEKIKDIVAQMPQESDHIDEKLQEILSQNRAERQPEIKPEVTPPWNELEEFASGYKETPIFERKPIDPPSEPTPIPDLIPSASPSQDKPAEETKFGQKAFSKKKKKSINDTVNKGFNIALNDRLIFIKHLFEGKTEDYTRVLSQINTMHTYEEAESFIQEHVKPDYKHWSEKEMYSERFMILVEKRFT